MYLPPATQLITAPASRGEIRLLFTREGARYYEQSTQARRKTERKTAALIGLGVIGVLIVDIVIVQSIIASLGVFSVLAGGASLVITTGFCGQTFIRLWAATRTTVPTQPSDDMIVRIRSRTHDGIIQREVQIGTVWWAEEEPLTATKSLAEADALRTEQLLSSDAYIPLSAGG
jgi:hypothetical protein